ncbi:hypothetical protein MMC16_007279 [Acarospora aff. strigata]|nr:hypothetical protein [Acarospora aff. strigata]
MSTNHGAPFSPPREPGRAPANHEQLLAARLNLIASDPDRNLPASMLVSGSEKGRKNPSEHPTIEDSGMESIESEPPSPTTGFPGNFSEVIPGIYRSSFPHPSHFEHLKTLGLKSILTLVPEPYPLENVEFVTQNGIRHFQIHIPANKDPFVTIPPKDMAAALKILLDKRNHPVLIHCNKGKHRTGCVVGCFRKIQDWSLASILSEYHDHANPKARVLDERFIELFDERAVASEAQEVGWAVPKLLTLPTPPASVVDDPKEDGQSVVEGR